MQLFHVIAQVEMLLIGQKYKSYKIVQGIILCFAGRLSEVNRQRVSVVDLS